MAGAYGEAFGRLLVFAVVFGVIGVIAVLVLGVLGVMELIQHLRWVP